MLTTKIVADTRVGVQQDGKISQPTEIIKRLAAAKAARRVHIERLILHNLDNHADRTQLVDEPALLTDESEAFFASHIEAAASRADWHAHFADPAGEIPTLCQQLLGDPGAFVAASKALARRLYDQMRPRTIAPGDFVAVVYTTGDNPIRHVALLKLDPDQRLIRTFARVGGHYRVTISTAGNLLPDTARLQKCALLTVPASGAGFDITLLDTQAGPRAAGIATFFYRGFLTAELAPSPRRHTREFLRCCDAWVSAHRDQLTPAALIAFYSARRIALAAETLDCASFAVGALPDHPTLCAELATLLAVSLAAAEAEEIAAFSIDRSVAGSVVNRVTLELDGGARLSVPADRFADLVRIEPARTHDNKVRIVIESLMLREVSDR